MRKLLIVAALVGVTLFSLPGAALAACDTSESTADGLRRAYVVFVGTVTGLENNDRTATFDVDWVWKGTKVYDEVTVLGGLNRPHQCQCRRSTVPARYPLSRCHFQLGGAVPSRPLHCDPAMARRWLGNSAQLPECRGQRRGLRTRASSPCSR